VCGQKIEPSLKGQFLIQGPSTPQSDFRSAAEPTLFLVLNSFLSTELNSTSFNPSSSSNFTMPLQPFPSNPSNLTPPPNPTSLPNVINAAFISNILIPQIAAF
jgi:hypothetical protein